MAEELNQSAPDQVAPDQVAPETVQPQPTEPNPWTDKLKNVYDIITKANYNIGDFNEFKTKMANPISAGKLFDTVSKDVNFGSKKEFTDKVTGYSQSSQRLESMNQSKANTASDLTNWNNRFKNNENKDHSKDLYNLGPIGDSLRPNANNWLSPRTKKPLLPTLAFSSGKNLTDMDTRQPDFSDLDRKNVTKFFIDPNTGHPTTRDTGANDKQNVHSTDPITGLGDFGAALSSVLLKGTAGLLRGAAYINPLVKEGDETSNVVNQGANDLSKTADEAEQVANSSAMGKAGMFMRLPAQIGGAVMSGGTSIMANLLVLAPAYEDFYKGGKNNGLSEGSSNLYAALATSGLAATTPFLGKLSGAASGAVQKYLAAGAIKATVDKAEQMGEEKITMAGLHKALEGNISKFKETLLGQGGKDFLHAVIGDGAAGGLNHAYNQEIQRGFNSLDNGKFKLEKFGQYLGGMAEDAATWGALGAMGGVAKFAVEAHHADPLTARITEIVAAHPDNANAIRQYADKALAEKVKIPEEQTPGAPQMGEERYNKIQDKVSAAEAISAKIPDTVTDPEVRGKAIVIISAKNEVQNSIDELKHQMTTTDEAFTDGHAKRIELLEEKKDGLNSQLKEIIATGKASDKAKAEQPQEGTPVNFVDSEGMPKEGQHISTDSDTGNVLIKDTQGAQHIVDPKNVGDDVHQVALENHPPEEEKQVVLNNSTSTDNPVAYKNISETRQKLNDLATKFKEEAKGKADDIKESKDNFLKGTKDLLVKLGDNAPANVKRILPQIIKLANSVKNEKSLGKALDKISSIVDDIHHKESQTEATKEGSKLKQTAGKFIGVDPELARAMMKLGQLGKDANVMKDPHAYSDFASSVIDKNGSILKSATDINNFSLDLKKEIDTFKTDKAIRAIQVKLDAHEAEHGETGYTAQDLYADPKLQEVLEEPAKAEREEPVKESKTAILNNLIKDGQQELLKTPFEQLSREKLNLLRALTSVNTENEEGKLNLSDENRKAINFIINNILQNGEEAILKGSDFVLQYHDADILLKGLKLLAETKSKSFVNWAKGIKKIKGFTDPNFKLKQSEDKVTLLQGLKNLNPDPEFVTKVYQGYFEGITRSFTRSQAIVGKFSRDLHTLNRHLDITQSDGVKIRAFMILRQIDRSSKASVEDQFEHLKGVVRDSFLGMQNKFKSGDVESISNMHKDQVDLLETIKKSGMYDLFTGDLSKITKENMAEQFGIGDKHKKVINFMDQAHEKTRPGILRAYEKYGIEASDIDHYTPMDFLSFAKDHVKESVGTTQSLQKSENDFNLGKAMDRMGGQITKRQDIASLPQLPGGTSEPTHFLNMDMVSPFDRGIHNQVLESETISDRIMMHNLLNDPRSNIIFDGSMKHKGGLNTNTEFFRSLSRASVLDALGRDPTSTSQGHTFLNADGVLDMINNAAKGAFYRQTLGSGMQVVQQYGESFSNAAMLLGDPMAQYHGIKFANAKDGGYDFLISKLVDKGVGVVARMADYERLVHQSLGHAYKAETTGYSNLWTVAKESARKVDEALLYPLKKGDSMVSTHTWIAAYMKKAKELGVLTKYSDFNKKFLETHEFNKDAMTYADGIVKSSNAEVSEPFKARVLRENIGPFKSFLYNMKTFQLHANVEARVALRNLVTPGLSSGSDWRQLFGYLAAQATSIGIKSTLKPWVQTFGTNIVLRVAMGSTAYHQAKVDQFEDQKKKGWVADNLNYDDINIISKLTGLGITTKHLALNGFIRFVSDAFLGQQNNIVQSIGEATADYSYKELWYLQLHNKIDKEQSRKSIFNSDANVIGTGVYTAFYNAVVKPLAGLGSKSIIDQIRGVATTKDRLSLAGAQFVASTLQLYGGADLGNISRQANMEWQKAIMSKSSILPDYYGLAKELVDKTDIEIKPFDKQANTGKYEDASGNPIEWTSSKIKDVDEEFAKQININLKSAGGLSIANKKDAKEIIESSKKEALSSALDKIVPGWKENKNTAEQEVIPESENNNSTKTTISNE